MNAVIGKSRELSSGNESAIEKLCRKAQVGQTIQYRRNEILQARSTCSGFKQRAISAVDCSLGGCQRQVH